MSLQHVRRFLVFCGPQEVKNFDTVWAFSMRKMKGEAVTVKREQKLIPCLSNHKNEERKDPNFNRPPLVPVCTKDECMHF